MPRPTAVETDESVEAKVQMLVDAGEVQAARRLLDRHEPESSLSKAWWRAQIALADALVEQAASRGPAAEEEAHGDWLVVADQQCLALLQDRATPLEELQDACEEYHERFEEVSAAALATARWRELRARDFHHFALLHHRVAMDDDGAVTAPVLRKIQACFVKAFEPSGADAELPRRSEVGHQFFSLLESRGWPDDSLVSRPQLLDDLYQIDFEIVRRRLDGVGRDLRFLVSRMAFFAKHGWPSIIRDWLAALFGTTTARLRVFLNFGPVWVTDFECFLCALVARNADLANMPAKHEHNWARLLDELDSSADALAPDAVRIIRELRRGPNDHEVLLSQAFYFVRAARASGSPDLVERARVARSLATDRFVRADSLIEGDLARLERQPEPDQAAIAALLTQRARALVYTCFFHSNGADARLDSFVAYLRKCVAVLGELEALGLPVAPALVSNVKSLVPALGVFAYRVAAVDKPNFDGLVGSLTQFASAHSSDDHADSEPLPVPGLDADDMSSAGSWETVEEDEGGIGNISAAAAATTTTTTPTATTPVSLLPVSSPPSTSIWPSGASPLSFAASPAKRQALDLDRSVTINPFPPMTPTKTPSAAPAAAAAVAEERADPTQRVAALARLRSLQVSAQVILDAFQHCSTGPAAASDSDSDIGAPFSAPSLSPSIPAQSPVLPQAPQSNADALQQQTERITRRAALQQAGAALLGSDLFGNVHGRPRPS